MNPPPKHWKKSNLYHYHCATKHTAKELYSSSHYMDWQNEPNPYRFYDGVKKIELPRKNIADNGNFFDVISSMNQRKYPRELQLLDLSKFLFYSMSISAWKGLPGSGERWSLRVNPSAGNLQPTELHLISNGIKGLPGGLYHYNVLNHMLERRSDESALPSLLSCDGIPEEFSKSSLLIILTTIFWRQAWKYQHRAFRYCHHDMGHALGAIHFIASALDLNCYVLGNFHDAEVTNSLGLQETGEVPVLIIAINGKRPKTFKKNKPGKSQKLSGVPNKLSDEEISYPLIEKIYQTTCCSNSNKVHSEFKKQVNIKCRKIEGKKWSSSFDTKLKNTDFFKVVRQRRSGVDFDGRSSMTLNHLFIILKASTLGFEADFQISHKINGMVKKHHHFIDIFLFVHRIKELSSGLYHYDRQREQLTIIQEGDQRSAARSLSLGQDIAANSSVAFSLIADLKTAYKLYGDRGYRYVHIESGHIGQGLYLTAEALGYNGTGVGAFFDDDVNKYLKLPEGKEVIYHFTIGRAIIDHRLATKKGYDFEA